MAKNRQLTTASLFGLSDNKTNIRALREFEEYQQQLQQYAQRLMAMLANNISAAYKPGGNAVYKKTGRVVDAARFYKMQVEIIDDTIRITCRSNYSGHRSIYGGRTVNALLLMDTGYTVHNSVWFKDIPWFGYRPAGNIIAKTLNDFARINNLGVNVEIEFGRF